MKVSFFPVVITSVLARGMLQDTILSNYIDNSHLVSVKESKSKRNKKLQFCIDKDNFIERKKRCIHSCEDLRQIKSIMHRGYSDFSGQNQLINRKRERQLNFRNSEEPMNHGSKKKKNQVLSLLNKSCSKFYLRSYLHCLLLSPFC